MLSISLLSAITGARRHYVVCGYVIGQFEGNPEKQRFRQRIQRRQRFDMRAPGHKARGRSAGPHDETLGRGVAMTPTRRLVPGS